MVNTDFCDPAVEIPAASRPPLLQQIHDPPDSLYARGDAGMLQRPCVAIVGTRRASPYGLHMARRLGHDLARAGVCVVSGLALGIDGAAHRGALDARGATAAVLAHGFDRLYPPAHRGLAEEILRGGGAWLTEYAPGSILYKANFPARNRIVAGLCLATIVVEAPLKSGALITAELALSENREVFAVPGPADRESFGGCHWLIQQGAALVTSADEVLSQIPHTFDNDLVAVPAELTQLEKWFAESEGHLTWDRLEPHSHSEKTKFWSAWERAMREGWIVELGPQHFSWRVPIMNN